MGKFLNFTADVEVESPGRINLIGEHIDYNGGFVLPTAIDKVIHFKLKKREDNLIHVESIGFENPLKTEINKDENPQTAITANDITNATFKEDVTAKAEQIPKT